MIKTKIRSEQILSFFRNNIAIDIILFSFLIMFFINRKFFSFYNMSQLLIQVATTLIVAVGVTFVIITGESDLSIGGLMCLSGIMAIKLQPHIPLPLIVLFVIALGCFAGCLTGLLVAYMKLNAFIVTLGIQMFYLGINLIITDGKTIMGTNPAFLKIGMGKVLNFFPYAFIIAMLFIVLAHIILTRTKFGRNCFAVGGNYNVAKYAGIHVVSVKLMCYIICGCLAALAGFFLSARMNAGNANFGTMIPFSVHCGIVIGGTYLTGGTGGTWQTFAGIFMMAVISNIMNILAIGAYWQMLIQGIIIVLIVGLACYEQMRKKENV